MILQVYDLSGGMAKMMSMAFVGKQVDGIWHTSVVVFGREYYFGGGICSDLPLTTPYGTPVERISMGITSKSREEFNQFLQSVSHRFTMDSYHIINHNCNNFTDECMRFLVKKKIPSHITGLPSDLLNTPLGQQFSPIINSMMSMKNQMFEGSEATVDHFADYASHELYFAQYKKIDGYPQYDEIANATGVIAFWDPRNDESISLGEVVDQLKIPFGFCDVLRNFYFDHPDTTPKLRFYVNGDIINDYTLEEFRTSINDIHEIANL